MNKEKSLNFSERVNTIITNDIVNIPPPPPPQKKKKKTNKKKTKKTEEPQKYYWLHLPKKKLEDQLQNKSIVFARQKQSVPKRRNNGSIIVSVGQKFWRNRSMSHCFRDTSIFVFCNFCEKFENSKWPPFLMGQFFFENWGRVTLGSKMLSLSSTVFEIQAFLCFAFLEKIRKFKMAAIFGE